MCEASILFDVECSAVCEASILFDDDCSTVCEASILFDVECSAVCEASILFDLSLLSSVSLCKKNMLRFHVVDKEGGEGGWGRPYFDIF